MEKCATISNVAYLPYPFKSSTAGAVGVLITIEISEKEAVPMHIRLLPGLPS